jgi:predicted nucleic acid-binding protein
LIVVDASVVANALADDGADGRLARRRLLDASDLAAPDLVDVETVSVLRRRWRTGDLTARRFSSAVDDLAELAVVRFPTLPLLRRAYDLRANVSAYDATYVALAEHLGWSLVTADARLSRAPGIRCTVEVIGSEGISRRGPEAGPSRRRRG